MEMTPDIPSRLGRIANWKLFAVDWPHVRELAVMPIADLCALSVSLHPDYVQLVRDFLTIPADEVPAPDEIAQRLAFRNPAFDEGERRIAVARTHILAGTLQPLRGDTAPAGECDTQLVRVADFLAWAQGLGWALPEDMAPGGCAHAPGGATSSERDKLLKHIAGLSLVLAEKSGRYLRGGKPNAQQLADAAGEAVDSLPDANARGLGSSSLRESIRQGLALLAK